MSDDMKVYHLLKRIIDIIMSIIGLIVLIPLIIIISVWIKVTSKGTIVYKHKRIGKNNIPFTLYKFRTMVTDARKKQSQGIPDCNLITSAGVCLRKTFLDETLQLINVLKGDMSLVGPRPLDIEIYNSLKDKKEWNDILKIKPGMTSIESVADYLPLKKKEQFERHFEGLIEKDKFKDFYDHRLLLDKYYVEHESFLLDIYVILYTIKLTITKCFKKNKICKN
jgi:lipopolysaccharide/colanic/teichoic acid biosynthesis glycosyltransferase